MKRFLILKTSTGLETQEFPYVADKLPAVYGNVRVFDGDTAPTQEQMSALFAPTYRELREKAYADPANACSVYDLADAETKLASPDPAIQAAGSAQQAAVLAKRLAIKTQYPKPE